MKNLLRPVDPNDHAPVITPNLACFHKIDSIVNKVYLPVLSHLEVQPCPEAIRERRIEDSACFFKLDKFVYDKNESIQQKLSSVYASAAYAGANLAMIIQADASGSVELYLGVCDENSFENDAQPKAEVVYSSFVGNFPGSKKHGSAMLDNDATKRLVNKCFSSDYHAIASVSGIASPRGTQKDSKNTAFFQGIEKVIEAMDGKSYAIVILARGIKAYEIEDMKAELEMLHTQLSPYSKSSMSISQSNADATTQSLSKSISDSIGKTHSSTLSVGESHSDSDSHGGYKGSSDSLNMYIGRNIGLDAFGANAGSSSGVGYAHSWNRGTNWNKTHSDGITTSETNTEGKTEVHVDTSTETRGMTVTVNSGQSIQLTFENKTVLEVLQNIEQQLKRLKTGAGMGMFATSTYFLSENLLNVRVAACAYKASISGDNTYLESSCINTWKDTDDSYAAVKEYLTQLCHPIFILNHKDEMHRFPVTVTPATIVTTPELAIHMSLPKSSVNGVSVDESVSFGRNIIRLNNSSEKRDQLTLGKLYHLGHSERYDAELDLDSLTGHVFITGTTGSGKSNTIYVLLEKLIQNRKDAHFLVIEPAKGEYKFAFANHSGDIHVYGTNPYIMPLLRINPFRFRSEVHVLEHLDRLTSIFNVCWPMSAAMPAVLKQALERAYQRAGWDLQRSVNSLSFELYPTFEDVMHEVEALMEESKYSSDSKGDYSGALCTRLRELTTGLNGMIFSSNDLSDEELFDCNVIVDLSRIGSPETKSLIMGLLVIKLQEYRQSVFTSANSRLKHITVLEEAHHLLKRTSTEQSIDSANLVGRSVEMLSNAFAEMRSSGESFIIADQSPEQMDLSVIRNTNTKIVMRLPSFEDRKLVGKSISLNDEQIVELARLQTGVAAVYQNDWINAVLVKMPPYCIPEGLCDFALEEPELIFSDPARDSFLSDLMDSQLDAWIDRLAGDKIHAIARLDLPTEVKRHLIEYIFTELEDEEDEVTAIGRIAHAFFRSDKALLSVQLGDSIEDDLEAWKNDVLSRLDPSVQDFTSKSKDVLMLLLVNEYASRDSRFIAVRDNLLELYKKNWIIAEDVK